ncbi:MAG: hypothetical protein V1492_03595 [Candidatus Micrarchaeota archaeon]
MKGQSTIEYITTYGWAILVLTLVLSVIFFSGVFKPDFFISEKCELGTNMPCRAVVYNAGAETKISLDILNSFPYKVEISSVAVTMSDGSAAFADFVPNKFVESGLKANYTATLSKKLGDNDLKSFSMNVTYKSCAPEFGNDANGNAICGEDHLISGRIVAKVIPSD